jgi:hypothetical protein
MQRRVPTWALVAVVPILVAIVVVASRPAPGSSSPLTGPAWLGVGTATLAQTLLILAAVGAMVATALNIWLVLPLRKGTPSARPWGASFAAYLYFAAALAFWVLVSQRFGHIRAGLFTPAGGGPRSVTDQAFQGPTAIGWLSVLLALVAMAAGVGLIWRWAGWRPLGLPAGAPRSGDVLGAGRAERAAMVSALDASLDGLRAERDPRRAVIAAYARLERVLGDARRPRRPPEAPLEYLARVLTELPVSAPAVQRLTDLFEWAKFSPHRVDPVMKDQAIEALQRVRDDLLAGRGAALT